MNWKDAHPALPLIAGGANHVLYGPKVEPQTRVGYARQAIIILCIAAFSSAVAGFSWGSVFASWKVGLGVAVVWFVLSCSISGLSVWIIDNLPRGWTWRKLGFFSVLCLFASLLSGVNTNFVMMLLFDPEISATIETAFRAQRDGLQGNLKDATLAHSQAHNERVTKAKKDIEAVDKELANQLATFRQQGDQKQAAYSSLLAQYAAVAGRRGARAKKIQVDAAQVDLQQARAQLASAETRLQEVREEKVEAINAELHVSLQQLASVFQTEKARLEQAMNDLSATPRSGFLHRHIAMWSVVERDPFFGILFLVLFFLIEAMPMLGGAAAPHSDYHQVLADDAAERDKQRNEKAAAAAEQLAKNKKRLYDARAALVNATIASKKQEEDCRNQLKEMGIHIDDINKILSLQPWGDNGHSN